MPQLRVALAPTIWFAVCASVATAAEPDKADTLAASALRRFAAAGVLWLWPAGSTIEGCFSSGTPDDRRVFVDAAGEWASAANIRVDFGPFNTGPAPTYRICPESAPFPPVRVQFGSGDASHAQVGTVALDRPSGKPNVFIVSLGGASKKQRAPDLVRAISLHELGHVLGLRHEHQHPESACFHMVAWKDLCTRLPGYRTETAQRLPTKIVVNFLPMIGQANPEYAAGAPYDPASIMHYKLSPGSFTGPASTCVGERITKLSDGDRRKIARFYPIDPKAQLDLIRSQAPILARIILATPDLDQTAAERLAREGERIVRRAHPGIGTFDIDLAAGLARLPVGRSDRGSDALKAFGAGKAEAAAAQCATANPPIAQPPQKAP